MTKKQNTTKPAAATVTMTKDELQALIATAAAAAVTEALKQQQPAAVIEQPATIEQPADLDELKAKRDKANAALIATIPAKNRAVVNALLKRLDAAGYPYARLARNKQHQLDALHVYPGERGRGRDDAFKSCATKPAREWAAKRDAAAKDGSARPKPLTRQFIYRPRGGGNLYARGIFGDMTD